MSSPKVKIFVEKFVQKGEKEQVKLTSTMLYVNTEFTSKFVFIPFFYCSINIYLYLWKLFWNFVQMECIIISPLKLINFLFIYWPYTEL